MITVVLRKPKPLKLRMLAPLERDIQGAILIGHIYGKLTVLERSEKANWLCRCECGNTACVDGHKLRSGHTQSCGCLHKRRGEAHPNYKHGHAGRTESPEYKSWSCMKWRCYNASYEHFDRYGGRGICVCERWLNSFENFLKDVGAKPSPQHSIDRINNDGNYEPGNCRWATRHEQIKNQKKTTRRGSAVNGARLTENEVLVIRNSYRALSIDKLAVLYGVNRSTIAAIKRRETWAHL